MEVILPRNNTRLKKRAKQYQNFSSSHQSFDEIKFIEAVDGVVILRGKEGRPDHMYPLSLISQRFWRWFGIYKNWMKDGFTTQCDELGQVLEMIGARIQEAIVQRTKGNTLFPVPDWVSPKYLTELSKALLQLQGLKDKKIVV